MHVLSGPIAVEGAQPGDLLIVDILDVGPIPQEDSGPLAGQGWGYTGEFATENGGGFLTEQFPDAYKVIWDFRGGVATSRHVPGVSFTGIVHPGLMGTAPSAALLARWNAREQVLIDTDPNRVPPLALPPLPDSAILGSLTGEEFDRAAAEAARTAPPRENGGNQDIKNLTKGTRVFYPVFVDGAKLSMGDLHFSQGDGEITFCGAIEMGGFMDLHVDLIKGGMDTYGVSENAIFMPGNVDPQYSQWLAFSGTSVTLGGEQRYLDSHLSYQRACLHAIDYLQKFGYSAIQAYMILGAAPIEGPSVRGGGHPELVFHGLHPDGDLRLRRATEQGRPAPDRSRPGGAEGLLLTSRSTASIIRRPRPGGGTPAARGHRSAGPPPGSSAGPEPAGTDPGSPTSTLPDHRRRTVRRRRAAHRRHRR